MAVYTEFTDEELNSFIEGYDIGTALSAKGIAEGVENSNYLLSTEAGQFILTLYERRVDPKDLPFFLGLMEHLAGRGLTCPTPVHARSGSALGRLADRPAAIISFLSGMWVRRPQAHHCAAVGRALAELHDKASDFELTRPNALSLADWRPLYQNCNGRADEVQKGLAGEIERELDFLETAWPKGLPTGVIHADLFPDNVFFLGGELSGLIDFYFACNDMLAYDLAICLNAWCFEADGSLNMTKSHALIAGYQAVRPLDKTELQALPLLARGSALRFLLTRLYDWLTVPENALVVPKDPTEYTRRLRFHRTVDSASAYGLDL